MDDDIPQAWWCQDVPLDYGIWTTGRYLLAYNGLSRVCDQIWVSTAELKNRYHSRAPRWVPPILSDLKSPVAAPVGCRRWGYHGTRVHWREHRWLVPLVRAVQEAVPSAEFEIFGERAIAEKYSGIPRVRVLPPVGWHEYLTYCSQSPMAVGVAPMLAGRFNDARSHVKLFDMLRCGAVGIFSDCHAYRNMPKEYLPTLLPNNHQSWTTEIIRLLSDDKLRLARFANILSGVSAEQSGKDIRDLVGDESVGVKE